MERYNKIKFNKIIIIMFALFLFGISSVQTVDASSAGLTTFYNPEIENNWNDLSGNGDDATSENGQTGTVFDGNNDYVLQNIANTLETSMSISTTFSTTSTGTSRTIVARSTNATDRQLQLYLKGSDNKIVMNFFDSDSNIVGSLSSMNGYFDGQKHYIVITQNGDTARMYIDNVLQDTDSTPGKDSDIQKTTIGAYYNGAGSYWQGDIYNLAIYNRELTQQEVTELYNNGGIPIFEDGKTEQTYSQSQLSNIAINDTDWHTITSGNFTITQNDTINYGEAIVFATSLTDNMIISCRTNLDGVNGTVENKLILQNGSVNSNILLRNNVTLSAGTHNISLECKNEIIGNTIIGASVGIGHVMKTADGENISYKNHQFTNTINSGATFTQIGVTTFNSSESLTGNKYILVDWSAQINNTHTQDQTISVYPRIENVISNKNCEQNIQFIKAGEFKTVGGVCILNVNQLLTNTISLYGTGITTDYIANFNIKEFDYATINETKTNILTGITSNSATFIEKASTTFTSKISNAEVIVKGSISATSLTNDVLFGRIVVEDETATVIYQSKDVAMNTNSDSNDITFQTITPIMSGTNTFRLLLRSSTGGLVTIDSGEINGYVVQKLDIEDNAFDINIFEFWNGTQLINFSAVVGGATFSTTGTTINAIGSTPFEDILINKEAYVSRLYSQHDTTLDLNASIGQHRLDVEISEIYTSNIINNFTLQTEIGSFSTTNGLITIYPFAGIYNWNVTTDTYFNKTNEEFQVAGSLTETTVINFIDSIINFENELNATVYPTCTWLDNTLNQTTNYEIAAQNEQEDILECRLNGYKTYDTLFNGTFPKNLTVNLEPAQIIVNIFNRQTGSPLLVNTNINILQLGQQNTSTGTTIFQNFSFAPGEYHLEASANGFYTSETDFVYTAESNAIVNIYLLNSTFDGSTTLVVPVIDEFFNIIEGSDTRLLEYDPSIFGFKEVSSCKTNSNGECKFLIEVKTKKYIVTTTKEIGGISFTARSSSQGEIFLPEISAGEEVPGQIFLNNLVLLLSSNLPSPESIGLTIETPDTVQETILSITNSTTIINIPVSFIAENNLAYTVCLEMYRTTSNNFIPVIDPVCTTGASGILPIENIELNNDFDYEARVTIEFDGTKTIYQPYLYPNNKSFYQVVLESGYASQLILFFWVLILSIALYLRNLSIWVYGSWILAVVQTGMFHTLLVGSASVAIIIINFGVLYLSKKQGDTL